MLLGNILAELLAMFYLRLHFNLRFDWSKTCGAQDYNRAPLLSLTPQVSVCRMGFISPANGYGYFQVFASGINIFDCFTSIFKLV